jgi:hypothetical protein
VHLDLIGKHRRVEDITGPVDVRWLEIRDTDPFDQAIVVQLIECRKGLGGFVLTGRPVDVEQVDVVRAEFVETLIGGLDDIVVSEVADPDFRGEKDILAGHVCGGDTLTDGRLVAVGLGGVDVAVAGLKRRGDTLGTLVVVFVLPGSQSEHRHPVRCWRLHTRDWTRQAERDFDRGKGMTRRCRRTGTEDFSTQHRTGVL